jgi:hypothetical protein
MQLSYAVGAVEAGSCARDCGQPFAERGRVDGPARPPEKVPFPWRKNTFRRKRLASDADVSTATDTSLGGGRSPRISGEHLTRILQIAAGIALGYFALGRLQLLVDKAADKIVAAVVVLGALALAAATWLLIVIVFGSERTWAVTRGGPILLGLCIAYLVSAEGWRTLQRRRYQLRKARPRAGAALRVLMAQLADIDSSAPDALDAMERARLGLRRRLKNIEGESCHAIGESEFRFTLSLFEPLGLDARVRRELNLGRPERRSAIAIRGRRRWSGGERSECRS